MQVRVIFKLLMVNSSGGVKRQIQPGQGGFTLIELLMAMTLFSVMLLIVVAGFMNVMRLRNESLASNSVQDSARTAMNEVVRSVRDSSGVLRGSTIVPGPAGRICLSQAGGQVEQYFVLNGVLTRSNDCAPTAPYVNPVSITSTVVKVTKFDVTQESSSLVSTAKPEMLIKLVVVTNNGTAVISSDGSAACSSANSGLAFCATTALKSGAVPR